MNILSVIEQTTKTLRMPHNIVRDSVTLEFISLPSIEHFLRHS